MGLIEDKQLALQNTNLFKVSQKAGRGQKWREIKSDIQDLEAAVEYAKNIEAYEVAVFVIRHFGGGFLYWSSKNPELFNSIVIAIEMKYIQPGL